MTPLGVHLSLGIMILSVEPGRWGHLYLVIMISKCRTRVDGVNFVSNNNDSKCRTREMGSFVFSNNDFLSVEPG